jgi:uncharacterized repeat protein (TIGR02543 family)
MRKRILSMALALCMLLTILPGSALAADEAAEGDNQTETTITAFIAPEQTEYELLVGADSDTISHVLAFPAEITAKMKDGTQAELAVIWQPDRELATDAAGTFTYTAQLTEEAQAAYTVDEGTALPQITVTVVAEDAGPMLLGGEDTTVDFSNTGSLTINNSNLATYDNAILTGNKSATSSVTDPILTIDGVTVHLTLQDLTIQQFCPVVLQNNATVYLTLKGTNLLAADAALESRGIGPYAGIGVPGGCTLEITAESTGVLTAKGGNGNGGGAGIGARGNGDTISGSYPRVQTAGTIRIKGGTVTAQGGSWYGIGGLVSGGAGIGGSSMGTNGNASTGIIEITGGTVKAAGGYGSAGIGAGAGSWVERISITGGTVTAKGGDGAAGIGSGNMTFGQASESNTFSCGAITISGGVVTATQGDTDSSSIGYGSLYNVAKKLGSISLTGGQFNLTGPISPRATDHNSEPVYGYTTTLTIYDGRLTTADNGAAALLTLDQLTVSGTLTVEENYIGTLEFPALGGNAGNAAIAVTAGQGTESEKNWSGALTLTGADASISGTIGEKLYPVTLLFHQANITAASSYTPAYTITRNGTSMVMAGSQIYTCVAGGNIEGTESGLAKATLYMTAGDETAVSVTAAGLSDGAMSVSGQTIAADAGGTTITMLNTLDSNMVTVAAAYYTGSALTPGLTVKDGSKTLTAGTDYEIVSCTNNTEVAGATDQNAPTVTLKGKGNYTDTISKKFAISYYPTAAAASAPTAWARNVLVSAPSGYTICSTRNGTYGASFVYSTQSSTASGTPVSYYLKQNTTGYITDAKSITVKVDLTAPSFGGSGEGITIADSVWQDFIKTITFGLLANTRQVSVKAGDTLSGVKNYYYYAEQVTDTAAKTSPLTAEQLASKSFTQDADGIFSVSADGNWIVYAYAVDNANNQSAYVCSNGVVVDTVAPTASLTAPLHEETLDFSASCHVQSSKAGSIYYVASKTPLTLADGNALKVQAGAQSISVTAEQVNTPLELALDGLEANTAYTIYAAAVDTAGNASAVQNASFTTRKARCSVQVTGGTASVDGRDATKVLEDVTVTVTTTARSGYLFTGWTSDVGVAFANNEAMTTTFRMPDTNVAVTATFKKIMPTYYTITSTWSDGGVVAPGGTVQVQEKTNHIVSVVPNKGYAVADVLVDGKSIGAVDSYTFTNVQADHTVSVYFRKAAALASPKTGDTAQPVLWASMMALSLGSLYAWLRKRRHAE